LTEALLERGAHVVVLDDLSTGHAGNLDAALQHPACALVAGSVLDTALVDGWSGMLWRSCTSLPP
jgi:UDP-glucose 4-epimerase